MQLTIAETSPWKIGILAGGSSSRMGSDKAHLPYNGQTLLARALETACAVLPGKVVVSGTNVKLPEDFVHVPLVGDIAQGEGPLTGVSSLMHYRSARWLVFAIDMPLMLPDALIWLLEQDAAVRDPRGLAVVGDSGIEPLFAIYAPGVLGPIEASRARGRRSPKAVLEDAQVPTVSLPTELHDAIKNINTPDDYAALIGAAGN